MPLVNTFRVIDYNWQFQGIGIGADRALLKSLCQVNFQIGNSPNRRSND
jgi:hypothetical protein